MDQQVTEQLREALAADEAAGLELLAAAARDGEIGAFELLARRISGRLMAFAVRSLGDRGLAEDAVQESLVRVYRFLPRYREQNFLGWCFTICARACADVRRREGRHRHADVVDVAASDDAIDAIDLRAAVEQAVVRLPEHLRTTFVLHQQGLAYDDVAGMLGVPVGTVRSRLHEARRILRAMLGGALRQGRNA